TPECEPVTCADLGWECGVAVDDCGNEIDCAAESLSCSSSEVCVGGIDGPTECIAGGGGPSTADCDVCDSIPVCTGDAVTKLAGRVITPGKNDADTANQVGVPNAFVYILRNNDPSELPAISEGIPAEGGD